jgi:predicted AlkP superfamily pyrophosphatase or phosphodiesterase
MPKSPPEIYRQTARLLIVIGLLLFPVMAQAQSRSSGAAGSGTTSKPKLVVIIVVDQMRADYVEKFGRQWTGGLRRLVDEGAWFREAAYPYAATETCVGHATISTGSLPSSHGMVLNEWWNRQLLKEVTCTEDPNAKDVGYAGVTAKGGDSAANMLIPAFADELKFQSGSGTRIVSFSLKARAAITLGGRTADAVTWFDSAAGGWVTSNAYPIVGFVEAFAKAHPVSADYGKKWSLLLPASSYLYEQTAVGSTPSPGFGATFPHSLSGKEGSAAADSLFYSQWQVSPYADTYLAHMAENAVDKLELGKRGGTDFLAISFSSPDYVGHTFGPRSWEIQDILARLDRDIGELFAHLDEKVGRGKYVVALTADHGVAPIPDDMLKAGMAAGWAKAEDINSAITQASGANGYAKDALAKVIGSDIYFGPGIYDKLKADPKTLTAIIEALEALPGISRVYRAEELADSRVSRSEIETAEANSFLKARNGDLLIVPKPFWSWDSSTAKRPRQYGATHGTPYYYDQRVPILLMGFGIKPGEYYGGVTPADIAPTLAALCGITLTTNEGHVLQQAIATSRLKVWTRGAGPAGRTAPN